MTAGELPSIAHVHETRPRGHQRSSGSTIEVRPTGQPLDDWLGDISDDDWSENATKRAERGRASPRHYELEGDVESLESAVSRERAADPSDRPVSAAEAHRAVIERRRLVAVLVVGVLLALAGVIALLLLRDGAQAPVARVPVSTGTTPAPSETRPSAAATAPSPSTTTPSTGGASTYALPDGMKLLRGEGDPALVEELQQALSRAGYDPGPTDGTFGPRTEAAVVAFQEANGLSVDGRVGPETASALNTAVAGG